MTAYVESKYVEGYYTESEAGAAVTGQLSAPSPLGAVQLVGAGIVVGSAQAISPLGAASLAGRVAVTGTAVAASPLGSAALRGTAIVAGRITAVSPLGAGAIVGTVVRYQLRGEVRDQGVLVNRRVRAHRRSNGALAAEGDTLAGVFVLDVGFSADEYYVVPINLAADATDFTPPCANRVVSVLAMDAA